MMQRLVRLLVALLALALSSASASAALAAVPPQIAKSIMNVRHRFALTYDSALHTDGVGSQLHRTYGIYCLSRFLKVQYYHTPLLKTDYQGLGALLANKEDDHLIARYNDIFNIPSDVDDVTGWQVYTGDHKINYDSLTAVLRSLEADPELKVVYSLAYPFDLAEQNPGRVYKAMSAVSPFRHVQPTASLLRVAIHVRRGDEMLRMSDRMLPNSYYINIAQQLAAIFNDMHIPFAFELFTEVPKNVTIITPDGYDMQRFDFHLDKNVTMDPAQNAIEEFEAIPNLIKAINADQVYAIERMATAHMFIMSRSSFSYIAAILNTPGLIFCHQFWHEALPQWILLQGEDKFAPEVEHTIRDWILTRFPRAVARVGRPVLQRAKAKRSAFKRL